MIPVNQPRLDGNEAKYLAQCIETGWISSEGPFVRRLEEGMAQVAGQRFGIDLRWTHPVRWRALRTLDLRLRAAGHVALALRFDEAANTLQLCDGAATLRCSAAVVPGSTTPLSNAWATVDVAASGASASGPDDPSVELVVFLRFAPRAAGASFVVETRAVDDDGNVQGYEPIGAVTVAGRAPSDRRLIAIRRVAPGGPREVTR